tara:strand:+ start:1374 stop:3617 length:2244 start_codon:yes stop_codon:yes gene_type:complete
MLQIIEQGKARKEARNQNRIATQGDSLIKLISLSDDQSSMDNIQNQINEFDDFATESGHDLQSQIVQELFNDKSQIISSGQEAHNYLSELYKYNPSNPNYTSPNDDEVREIFSNLTTEDLEKSGITDVTLSEEKDLISAKQFLQDKITNDYADSIFYNMDWMSIMQEMTKTNNSVFALEQARNAGVKLKGSKNLSIGSLMTIQKQRESALMNKLYLLQEQKGFKLHGDESSLTKMRDNFVVSMHSLNPQQFAAHYEQDKNQLAKTITQKIQLSLHYTEQGQNTKTFSSNSDFDDLNLDAEVLNQIFDVDEILSKKQYFGRAQDFTEEATELNYLYKELFGEFYSTDTEYLKSKDGKYFDVENEYNLLQDDDIINLLSENGSNSIDTEIQKELKNKNVQYINEVGEAKKQVIFKTLYDARNNNNFAQKLKTISENSNISTDDIKTIFKEEENKFILTDEALYSGNYMSTGYNEDGSYKLEWRPESNIERIEFTKKMENKKLQLKNTEILKQANEMQSDAPIYVDNIGKKIGQDNYLDVVKILGNDKNLDITKVKEISKGLGFFVSESDYPTGGYNDKDEKGIGSFGLGVDGKEKQYNAKDLIKTWNSAHGQESIESFIKYYGNDDVISNLSNKQWVDLENHLDSVTNVIKSITSKKGVINRLKGGTKFAVDLIKIAEKYADKMYGKDMEAGDDKSIYLSTVKLKLKKAFGIDKQKNRDADYEYRNKTINEFLRWSKAFDESNYKKFNL